jgi:hypothetical protein
MIDTEEWGELAEAEPQMAQALTDEFMQSIVDDYSSSRRAGVVALDEDFWIVRTPLVLDSLGVIEVMDASRSYENEVLEIAARSAQRRSAQGTAPVPTSHSVAFFKMPRSTPPR